MIVGTVEIRLSIRDARSLKDKRSVLLSLKERLRRSFNVSVAEVGNQDVIQSAILGVAQVSNDGRHVNATLDRLVDAVRKFPAVQLVDYSIQIF
jgi:uncharacterized protein YlxP (DUF503 family)